MSKVFSVTAKLKVFDMAAPWTYLPVVPKFVPDVKPGGWGSIPIEATIGATCWKTSMFPLKNVGYFIPIKKLVLKKENLKAGQITTAFYTVA